MSSIRVGPYAILSVLGTGSFATVYKAVHESSGTIVAVKAIVLAKLDRKALESLENEISVLRKLDHPNIVRLLDVARSSTFLYLILEYCPDGDLASALRRSGPVDERACRHVMRQLARGLRWMWTRDLVHRDLKPQNLLLVGQFPFCTVKIADFGFARRLAVEEMAETLCGSPLYMAPEILRLERYDSKCDLWSCGAIMFEMLVGRPPFEGVNILDLVANMDRSEAVLPADVDARLSPAARHLLAGLLRKKPLFRISMSEFFDSEFIREEEDGGGDASARIPSAVGGRGVAGGSGGGGGVAGAARAGGGGGGGGGGVAAVAAAPMEAALAGRAAPVLGVGGTPGDEALAEESGVPTKTRAAETKGSAAESGSALTSPPTSGSHGATDGLSSAPLKPDPSPSPTPVANTTSASAGVPPLHSSTPRKVSPSSPSPSAGVPPRRSSHLGPTAPSSAREPALPLSPTPSGSASSWERAMEDVHRLFAAELKHGVARQTSLGALLASHVETSARRPLAPTAPTSSTVDSASSSSSSTTSSSSSSNGASIGSASTSLSSTSTGTSIRVFSTRFVWHDARRPSESTRKNDPLAHPWEPITPRADAPVPIAPSVLLASSTASATDARGPTRIATPRTTPHAPDSLRARSPFEGHGPVDAALADVPPDSPIPITRTKSNTGFAQARGSNRGASPADPSAASPAASSSTPSAPSSSVPSPALHALTPAFQRAAPPISPSSPLPVPAHARFSPAASPGLVALLTPTSADVTAGRVLPSEVLLSPAELSSSSSMASGASGAGIAIATSGGQAIRVDPRLSRLHGDSPTPSLRDPPSVARASASASAPSFAEGTSPAPTRSPRPSALGSSGLPAAPPEASLPDPARRPSASLRPSTPLSERSEQSEKSDGFVIVDHPAKRTPGRPPGRPTDRGTPSLTPVRPPRSPPPVDPSASSVDPAPASLPAPAPDSAIAPRLGPSTTDPDLHPLPAASSARPSTSPTTSDPFASLLVSRSGLFGAESSLVPSSALTTVLLRLRRLCQAANELARLAMGTELVAAGARAPGWVAFEPVVLEESGEQLRPTATEALDLAGPSLVALQQWPRVRTEAQFVRRGPSGEKSGPEPEVLELPTLPVLDDGNDERKVDESRPSPLHLVLDLLSFDARAARAGRVLFARAFVGYAAALQLLQTVLNLVQDALGARSLDAAFPETSELEDPGHGAPLAGVGGADLAFGELSLMRSWVVETMRVCRARVDACALLLAERHLSDSVPRGIGEREYPEVVVRPLAWIGEESSAWVRRGFALSAEWEARARQASPSSITPRAVLLRALALLEAGVTYGEMFVASEEDAACLEALRAQVAAVELELEAT